MRYDGIGNTNAIKSQLVAGNCVRLRGSKNTTKRQLPSSTQVHGKERQPSFSDQCFQIYGRPEWVQPHRCRQMCWYLLNKEMVLSQGLAEIRLVKIINVNLMKHISTSIFREITIFGQSDCEMDITIQFSSKKLVLDIYNTSYILLV